MKENTLSIYKNSKLCYKRLMGLPNKSELPAEGLTIESLMEALFYRDEFLSIASHELRTPLTTLKLQAQVFKRNSKKENGDSYSKEKVDRLIDSIDSQTNRLMKLIDDMLDISRIRSGKLFMSKETFNLTELLKEVSLEYSVQAEVLKEINFLGDEQRIAQVLRTLLNNAARYGKGSPIEVKLVLRKNKILISVTDHGQGISDEDQKRIFHRFQRAVAASEISGLGLGLYIAREIVEAHGGKISVKSELDKGSVFTVQLPLENV